MTLIHRELHEYQLGVQTIYLHDWAEGTDLYKRAGETTLPEEMAEHDGPVVIDGELYHAHEGEYGGYEAHHPFAGRMERFGPDEERDAVLLTRLEATN